MKKVALLYFLLSAPLNAQDIAGQDIALFAVLGSAIGATTDYLDILPHPIRTEYAVYKDANNFYCPKSSAEVIGDFRLTIPILVRGNFELATGWQHHSCAGSLDRANSNAAFISLNIKWDFFQR